MFQASQFRLEKCNKKWDIYSPTNAKENWLESYKEMQTFTQL